MYLGFHVWSLGFFPFVHSDEAWLASLSRTMLETGSLSATEDFFRLTPRHPHAIKALFHLLQIPLVALSFSHVSVRVISLLGGLAALFCFYRALRKLGLPLLGAAPASLLLGLDVQFFSSSHVARQEILLVAVMAAAFCAALPLESWRWRTPVVLGLMLGAAIGLHPNAFVVTLPFLALVFWVPVSGRRKLAFFAVFVGLLLAWAGAFVGWSYAMDPAFPSNYLAFGQSVGVADSPFLRLLRLRLFFVKLYQRVAGTYYLPPVRLQLLVFAGLLPLGALTGFLFRGNRGRHVGALTTAAGTVVIGLYLVGKFSPPTAVFLWLPCYLLGATLFYYLSGSDSRLLVGKRRLLSLLPVLFLAGSLTTATVTEALRFEEHRYGDYIAEIRATVPSHQPVLANLNTAFAFSPGVLHTFRDLDRLDVPIAEYLERESIRYVLLPSEMEIIYAERPQWNLLYGNIYPYFGDLLRILDTRGVLIETVEAPVHAMRIVPYMFSRDAKLQIYRLTDEPRDAEPPERRPSSSRSE
ncbi:MAG: ArnT family glycosyltransferase [Spirochaetota bacterium]